MQQLFLLDNFGVNDGLKPTQIHFSACFLLWKQPFYIDGFEKSNKSNTQGSFGELCNRNFGHMSVKPCRENYYPLPRLTNVLSI